MASSIIDKRSLIKNIRDSIKDNKRCFDCHDDKIPEYVCTTFGIFVCLRCALLHREFRHKIKNIMLSSFSDDELNNLKATGNNVANSIWLSKWDNETSRPDNEDDLRDFIKNVWVLGKWKKDEEVQQRVVKLNQSIATNNEQKDEFNQTIETLSNGLIPEMKAESISSLNKNDNTIQSDLLLDFSSTYEENILSRNNMEGSFILNSTLSNEDAHVINTTLVHNSKNLSTDNSSNMNHNIINSDSFQSNFKFPHQQPVQQKSFLDIGDHNMKNVDLFGYSSSSIEYNPFQFEPSNGDFLKKNQINFDNSTENIQKSNSESRFDNNKLHFINNNSLNMSGSFPESSYKPKPYIPPSYKHVSEQIYLNSFESNEYIVSPTSHSISQSLSSQNSGQTPQIFTPQSGSLDSVKQLYNFDNARSQSYDEDYLLAMKLQKEEEEEAKKRDFFNSQILKSDELLAKSLLNSTITK